MSILSLSFLLSSLVTSNAAAEVVSDPSADEQKSPSGLLTRSVGAQSYSYQLYVPEAVRGRKGLPVLLFLHGIGQRGSGGYVPASGPGATLLTEYLERVPGVVLLPQCPPNSYWHDEEVERMVMASLERTVEEFDADVRRLYVAGVSMGGFGAWHLASRHSGRFAAVVSICGGSPLPRGEDRFTPVARGVGRTPAWVFHGSDDRVVPVSESRRMVKALKAVEGSQVRYSEYPGVGHNVWLKVLGEADLLPWIFSQRVE